MAVWNIKYSGEFFSSNQTCSYKIDLYQKDYTSTTIQSIYLSPDIIQEWQDDDPKTPIRGCTLKIGIIANNPITGMVNIPFETFYSNEDDTWKVTLTRKETDEILFVGYLLQDDCSEICVDYTHIYNLTFTDNLGVMKDVSLLDASVALPIYETFSSITVYSFIGNDYSIFSMDSRWGILNIGNTFTIYSGGLAGTYTVIDRGYSAILGWFVKTAELVPVTYSVTDDIDYQYYTQGITGYHTFKDIFQMLIYSTGIKLTLNIMSKLVPVGGSKNSLIEDTYIDVNSFYKNGEWMNCYDILEQICMRFNACFFQAHGQWYFVRWDELYRYTNVTGAEFLGDAFNSDMNNTPITKNVLTFDFFGGKDMETGTMKSIIRPDLYAKETFNYVQPDNILCNSNLQELGAFRTEYVSGPYLLKEYDSPSWQMTGISTENLFIRITYDNDITSTTYKQELDRNIVIQNAANFDAYAAKSCDIYISQGDSIDYSFSFRTAYHQSGSIYAPYTLKFVVSLQDGTNTYYLGTDGSWVSPNPIFAISVPISSTDDSFDWHYVTVKSKITPIGGIINVFLADCNIQGVSTPTNETLYKDFNLIMNYNIAGSGKIIGHTHNTQQYINIKKINEKDIYIDDTPRININGSLYLYSYTGLLRNLTTVWTYNDFGDLFDRLGQATTEEALFTSSIPRYKYEGNLIYINILDEMLTPFSVFNLKTADNQFRFVPGKMTINYHANMAEVTLWEFIRNEDGIISDQRYQFYNEFLPNKTYNFNYLYEKN